MIRSGYRGIASEILTVLSDDGRELTCSCPFHEDRRPSFRLNAASGLWMCHSCKEAGHIKRLYKELTGEELVVDDAMKWQAALDLAEKNAPEPEYESLESACLNQFAYRFRSDYRAVWEKRGITDEHVMDKFGLGYDVVEHALTIPTEYGVVRRYLDSEHKYRFPPGMPKSHMLYGADYVTNQLAVVCEGQIDALCCWQAGFDAVAIFGSSASKHQVEKIRMLPSTFIVLFMDDDEQGWECADKLERKLSDTKFVREVDYSGHEGKDPGSMDSSSIVDLVHAVTEVV